MKHLICIMCLLFFDFLSIYANRTNRNLNLQQLQNRCLTRQSTAPKSYTCVTQRKLKMQMTKGVENGIFYCLTYEKFTGNMYGFDSLTIELHPDYELQYSGANVIDFEFPSFKLYDVRVTEEYKGRFAIFSNNTSFNIYQVTINNEPQSCIFGKGKSRKVWPEPRKQEIEDGYDIQAHSSSKKPVASSTTMKMTTVPTVFRFLSSTQAASPEPIELLSRAISKIFTFPPISTTDISITPKEYEPTTEFVQPTTNIDDPEIKEQCGETKKVINLKQFDATFNAGEFPAAVSIFQFSNVDRFIYKCSGTIIRNNLVLTTVNCLLDHNSKLLNENNIVIVVASYSSMLRNIQQNQKIYYTRTTQYVRSDRLESKGTVKRKPLDKYETASNILCCSEGDTNLIRFNCYLKYLKVKNVITHEEFNFNLDNNIAAIKMRSDIEFDDFVQPICLPAPNMDIDENTNAKVVGFGRSSMLTEVDFNIKNDIFNEQSSTFNAISTTSVENVDLGCGLYITDKSNHWTLIGISSIIPHKLSNDDGQVSFTNVMFYIEWIEKLLN